MPKSGLKWECSFSVVVLLLLLLLLLTMMMRLGQECQSRRVTGTKPKGARRKVGRETGETAESWINPVSPLMTSCTGDPGRWLPTSANLEQPAPHGAC
jgi:hypothetical protein